MRGLGLFLGLLRRQAAGSLPPPSFSYYRRPGGVDRYLRPDGVSFYLRP